MFRKSDISDYTYTGQYSHAADFGLMFYCEASLWDNARWYDLSLGRFASADSIVPGGVQGYDRYAYVSNNPLRYTDPSGHMAWEGGGGNYTFEDEAHDAYLHIWSLRRSWEGHNRWEIMEGALRHEPHMDIVGHGLEVIKQDPDVLDVWYRMTKRIMNDPRYQVEEFPTDSIGNDVELGNQGIDMFNDDTWTQRNAKLDATSVTVDKNGNMTVDWSTRDTLDLTPDWNSEIRVGWRKFLYNSISFVAGSIWHEGLGASRTMTTSASWQQTYPIYCR